MYKYLFLLVISFLLFVQPAHASNQEQKQNYDNQLEILQQEIDGTEDRQALIKLVRKSNEIAAYQRAYEKALEHHPSTQRMELTESVLLNTGQPPKEYIPIYKNAAEKYNIDWTLLAAVHKVETNFSNHNTMISSAGAIGHMQFMPATWDYYGVDANNDGKADPWDIEDAIFSAANYLAATGAKNDQKKALFAYNRSNSYGQEVMSISQQYKETYSQNNISVVNVGKKYINNSIYVFGGGRNQTDISRGRFDCSSFVHWAFDEVGITLGDLASTTTDTLKKLGEKVNLSDIQPGDLVFFDTYKKDGHVGIYVGNGQFIGAQESTGVAVADMTTGYWKDKFNGRVKRL